MKRPQTSLRKLTVAVAACFATSAFALPTGPAVVSGSASVSQNGNALNVTNSNGAILNWQKFGIAANEIVRFNQASASSSVLNRVVGADPSQIHGQLLSNGRVWLINPAGVMIGPGGMINTAGFVASTLNVSNQDFLAGRLNFQATPGAGNVVNQGGIVTPSGGTVYLVGANVANEGSIATPNGETILAAGQTVSLIDTATPGVKVEITGTEGRVTNLGEIAATAGRIGMAGVLVKNAGTLNASSVAAEGGRIFLRASKRIEIDAGGRIVADGKKGGDITAITQYGGEVTGELVARGEFSAQGDGTKGSGGFIETSAAKVDLNGIVVRTRGGEWLIDPNDFTIAASGGDMTGATLAASLGSGDVTILSSSGTTVGNGDIFVNDAVAKTGATDSTLTLKAVRSIVVNQPITSTNSKLGVTLNAHYLDNGAAGNVQVGASITTNGGNLTIGGGIDPTMTPAIGYDTSDIGAYGAYIYGVNAGNYTNLNAGTGSIRILGRGIDTITNAHGVVINTYTTLSAGGGIYIEGTGGTTGGYGIKYVGGANSSIQGSGTGDISLYSTTSDIYVDANISTAGKILLRADKTGVGTGTVTFGSLVGDGASVGASGSGRTDIYYNPVNYWNPGTKSDEAGNPYSSKISGPYGTWMLVNSAANLQAINNNVAGYYALGKSISGAGFTAPIGNTSGNPFTGKFDGLNQTISNLSITCNGNIGQACNAGNGTMFVGLFGNVSGSAIISNLGLTNATITTDSNAVTSERVGILAGYNDGTISNVYTTGTINATKGTDVGGLIGSNSGNISNSYSKATVNGQGYVGGLVGSHTYATISNSYATGNVTATSWYSGGLAGYHGSSGTINDSYATGNVTSTSYQVGGLVGYNSGTINRGYASGRVEGTFMVGGLAGYNTGSSASSYGKINDSHATGTVYGADASAGSHSVGGFIGENRGEIARSYSTGNASSATGTNVGGFAGLTTSSGGSPASAQYSFWDSGTSGNLTSTGTASGKTTAQLMSALDANWSTSTWGLVAGTSYPYLKTIFTNGVQVVSGTVANPGSSTTMSLAKNAALLGTTAMGANGFYYSALPAGTIAAADKLLVWAQAPASGTTTYGAVVALANAGHNIGLDYANGSLTLKADSGTFSADSLFGVRGLLSGNIPFVSGDGYRTLGDANVKKLRFAGAGSFNISYIGDGDTNYIDTLAASAVNSLSYTQVNSFAVGTVGTTTGISSSGTVTLRSTGVNKSIAINSGASISSSAGDIVIAASGTGGSFSNNGGASALGVASGHRWLVYAASPANTTKGGLTSSFRRYAQAYGSGTLPTNGNGFVYQSAAGTVTVAPSGSSIYGNPIALSYSLTGVADSEDNADNIGLSGTPSLTSQPTQGSSVGSYSISYLGGLSNEAGYTFVGGSGTYSITPRPLTITAFGTVSKVYDGTTNAAFGAATFSGLVNNDSLSLTGNAAYDTRHVGGNKRIDFSNLVLAGSAAGNYTLVSAPASRDGNAITQRPLSTWIGGSTGIWSLASNWDALPDGSNVAAVAIPAGRNVTFDAATAATTLDTLTIASGGGLVMAGGTLGINSSLTTPSYAQTGGTLYGNGSFTVTQSFSKTGGLFKPGGSVNIAQASGNIDFVSDAAIILGTLTASNGDILIDNTGGITTGAGLISASGKIAFAAHSPITIGGGGLAAGNGIALAAKTAGADSVITLNGALTSNSGNIGIDAYGNIAQNANISAGGAGNIGATSSSGNITMGNGALTKTVGGSIGYAASKGNITLALLDAGTGGIALDAGGSILPAAGSSGANIVGGSATLKAGSNITLKTKVKVLDVDVAGSFSITDAVTGTSFSDTAATPVSTDSQTAIENATEDAHDLLTDGTTDTAPAPPTTADFGPTGLTSGGDHQTIGGEAGSFGGGDTSPDKTAAADTDKKEEKKEDKKDDKDAPDAKKKDSDNKPAKKAALCTS